MKALICKEKGGRRGTKKGKNAGLNLVMQRRRQLFQHAGKHVYSHSGNDEINTTFMSVK